MKKLILISWLSLVVPSLKGGDVCKVFQYLFEQEIHKLPHFEDYNNSSLIIVDTNYFTKSCPLSIGTSKLQHVVPDSIGTEVFYLDSIVEGVDHGDAFFALYFTSSFDRRSFEYIALWFNDDLRFVGSQELEDNK